MSAKGKSKEKKDKKEKKEKKDKKGNLDDRGGSPKSEAQLMPDIYDLPHDTLVVKIMSLRTTDAEPKYFSIKVMYFDQLLLMSVIKSATKDEDQIEVLAQGNMNYDPSDYEKMCLFADSPLIVHIQPCNPTPAQLRKYRRSLSQGNLVQQIKSPPNSFSKNSTDISCCNVDILAIFLSDEDNQKICVRKRMEPMIIPSSIHCKSWDTLPLLTMEVSAERNPENIEHHRVLKEANWMKLTVIAAYNMYKPYEDGYVYTAASNTPLYCDTNVGLVTYNQGYREPKRFQSTNFYPRWENLRTGNELFTLSDQKLQYNIEDIQNDDDIDLPYYLDRILPYHTAVWGSFHRTLMLNNCGRWLRRHLRQYKWPLEMHIYGEDGGYSFMTFLNLFQLLYPGGCSPSTLLYNVYQKWVVKGVDQDHHTQQLSPWDWDTLFKMYEARDTVCLAVPLHWVSAYTMMQECGCSLLLAPNTKEPSSPDKDPITTPSTTQKSKSSKYTSDSVPTSISTLSANQVRATGADGNCGFVLVEVKLGRPLKSVVLPTRILQSEISAMLTEFENESPYKRYCTGRGQLERDWQLTVKYAANSLRKVPYYGFTEFCTFNRQLSETRTRVELMASCWQEAATFINNNFVVQNYLHSDDMFEELVMMAHACMVRSAIDTLSNDNKPTEMEPTLRAARHARQMQDTYHAMELYMRVIVDRPRDADYWRELSTCLKDLDRDWANACLNKSVVLNPRHPLTLLSKGGMLFEEDPEAAEPFFVALLAYHPTWFTMWVIVSAYYYERELYHMADVILKIAKNRPGVRLMEEAEYSRSWERELGDWWDCTPLLPGMNHFFDAADLLLRLRAIPLAEVCLARALSETGESAAYYHLVGLCWRLRGEYKEALCNLDLGLEKYGEVNYIRSLEAECQHRLGNISEAMASFDKAGSCISAFSILMSMPIRDARRSRAVLVDLVRRQPSAYAWTALAEDWLKRINTSEHENESKPDDPTATNNCAVASCIQALQIDRLAGRTWALLASLVSPAARRMHCVKMANICGWEVSEEELNYLKMPSTHRMCHKVATSLRECHCFMSN